MRGFPPVTTSTPPKRSEVPTEHTWNLETIYPTDAAWEADFQRLTAMLPQVASFQGHLAESAQVLLQAFRTRDEATQILGHLFVYAHMRLDQDTANSVYQALNDRATTLANEFSAAAAYLAPELLAIPEARLQE